ncbi:MAG: DinB family protein [Ilumatobacteraceae bacterium]
MLGLVDAIEHERCAGCGFDGSGYDRASLLSALEALGPRWRVLLEGAASDLRVRPNVGVWSAIEYAAHSRDITALHVFGVEQALTVDEPVYPAIEADDLINVAVASYAGEDPKATVDALDAHACRLARLAGEANADAWTRGITIGADRSTVRRLVEHGLHDSLHHLDDVERGLQCLRTPRTPTPE